MRALVQRVGRAAVGVGGEQVAAIGPGLLVLLGVRAGDGEAEADRLADKVRALRIFDDAEGRMNEPLGEREVLCVSQFTLYADTRKGNRPSYIAAATPRDRRAALRPLLRPAWRRAGGLRRADGGRAGQRRPGHGAGRTSEGVERREQQGPERARDPWMSAGSSSTACRRASTSCASRSSWPGPGGSSGFAPPRRCCRAPTPRRPRPCCRR